MNRDVRGYDVVVVGGGPAGMAAAWAAAQGGKSVVVLDDNPACGGQVWRGEANRPKSRLAASWFARLREAPDIAFIGRARVVMQTEPGALLIDADGADLLLGYDKLVLATGARELFLPFPGWTLPGVTGAGGLQALVKSGLPVDGRRVVVAGSGPLLLAVAACLRVEGARVLCVAEQAPGERVRRFALRLLRSPLKLAQAAALRGRTLGTPYRHGVWPVEARGNGRLEAVRLTNGTRTWTEPCDYLGCGFGLVPSTELPAHLGCEIRGDALAVDACQESTVPGVYGAGEVTGVGGVELAVAEGLIAGYAAAGREERARRHIPSRESALSFAQSAQAAFALREELKSLPRDDTLVCRCEDVALRDLRAHAGWRDAKLHTRCGMGPCQGRVCGPATRVLLGWEPASVRPPIFPARVGVLAQHTENCFEG